MESNTQLRARLAALEQAQTRALISASKRGDKLYVLKLCGDGCNVDLPDKDGLTAIIHATNGGHQEVVEVLCQSHANLSACDNEGRTALHYASRLNSLVIAQTLIRYQADVDFQDKQKMTALHVAVSSEHMEIVGVLLRAGASVNLKNAKNETPTKLTSNKKILALLREAKSEREKFVNRGEANTENGLYANFREAERAKNNYVNIREVDPSSRVSSSTSQPAQRGTQQQKFVGIKTFTSKDTGKQARDHVTPLTNVTPADSKITDQLHEYDRIENLSLSGRENHEYADVNDKIPHIPPRHPLPIASRDLKASLPSSYVDDTNTRIQPQLSAPRTDKDTTVDLEYYPPQRKSAKFFSIFKKK